jgi:hypothetical protein
MTTPRLAVSTQVSEHSTSSYIIFDFLVSFVGFRIAIKSLICSFTVFLAILLE